MWVLKKLLLKIGISGLNLFGIVVVFMWIVICMKFVGIFLNWRNIGSLFLVVLLIRFCVVLELILMDCVCFDWVVLDLIKWIDFVLGIFYWLMILGGIGLLFFCFVVLSCLLSFFSLEVLSFFLWWVMWVFLLFLSFVVSFREGLFKIEIWWVFMIYLWMKVC